MVTISKPLSAGQAQAYHQSEFMAPEQSYYSGHDQIRGEWQGKLAAEWGLQGEVTEQQFARLANGQHPETGAELVRHRESFEYRNANGESVRTMEHRAGWDATFSAPKSVSLTALVGRDQRIRDAHRESVRIAVDELERYVQARMGGSHPAETTGKWAAAKFEHDSARPVDGYSAPQLHTHVVFFNVSQSLDGATHAIQPRELYKSQQYVTSVYRSELAVRLKALGYELDCDRNGAPEIRGYTAEYLEASSPRRQQILEHLENQGLGGAGPAQIAALRTRDAKTALSAEETLDCHLKMASRFGNQAQRVVEEARSHARQPIPIDREKLLLQFPPETALMVRTQVEALDGLEKQVHSIEQRIAEVLAPTPMVQRLKTLPGVGAILAPVIAFEIGDIARFPRAEQLASYAGLVPRVKSSGGHTRLGRTSNFVNPFLKWAFVEAANCAVKLKCYQHSHVKHLFLRLKHKGYGRAIVAVARHLAEAAFWVLVKDEDYRPPRARSTEERAKGGFVHQRVSARHV